MLGALLLVVIAAGYQLDIVELSYSTRGVGGAVQAATFTDVNAQQPAYVILTFVALASAALLLANIWFRTLWLLAIAVVAWLGLAILLACILIGQPTLRRNLKLGVLAALDQRITTRYTLEGMTRDETTNYLTHHLRIAGRSDTLFSDDAAALIHKTSRGYPRTVNNLALQALVAAFANQKAIVDESSARAAVTEITSE